MRVPLGLRAARRSVAAMKPASTQATVVKKPKTFWMRVKDECILEEMGRARCGAAGEVGGLDVGCKLRASLTVVWREVAGGHVVGSLSMEH